MKFNKLGQEEMVGFAIIMIIVAIILLIFLSFSLTNSEKEIVESYEVGGFLQAILQYTTDCRDNLEYLSIQDLVFDCQENRICSSGKKTCDVLNSTLAEISKESWKVEGDRPIKGYDLTILVEGENLIFIKEGNATRNSKGSVQDFSRRGQDYSLIFNSYY